MVSPILAAAASAAEESGQFKMPEQIRVIGTPEEGGELRVWAPEGDTSLGLIKFAWFRTPAVAAR